MSRTFTYTTEQWGAASDGATLSPLVFPPTSGLAAACKFVIHEGGFKSGRPGPAGVCQDLADAGYWAIAIPYRLAPPGRLPNQTKFGGRFPGQTDDLDLLITYALADSRFTSLDAVGGSCGGSHALWCANRFRKVVALSPAVDFNASPQNATFTANCINYVGSSMGDDLYAASPSSICPDITVPVLLRASQGEGIGTVPGMPPEQYLSALALIPGVSAVLLSGQLHAFAYWSTVKTDVLAFIS